MHIDLDESNDIVITLREGTSGGYTEYSIIAYSTAGGKWNRQLEVYYGAPTYLNSPLLMDIEGTTIHYLNFDKTIFATIRSQRTVLKLESSFGDFAILG